MHVYKKSSDMVSRFVPFSRTQPLHDSTAILLVRSSHYYKQVEAVKKWYTQEHDNWHTVDGQASKWWVWQTVRGHTLTSACQIQQYMANVNSGITCMCNFNYTARCFSISHV